MNISGQLLCAALVCFPTATALEVNRAPLKPYTLLQIELPYGVMPHWDLLNPTYGMTADNQIEWMAESAWEELSDVLSGRHPDVWPNVPLPIKAAVPPKLSRPQAALQRRLQLRAEHRYRGPLWQLPPKVQIVVRPLPVE